MAFDRFWNSLNLYAYVAQLDLSLILTQFLELCNDQIVNGNLYRWVYVAHGTDLPVSFILYGIPEAFDDLVR